MKIQNGTKKILTLAITFLILAPATASEPYKPLPMPSGEGDPIYQQGKVFGELGVHLGFYSNRYGLYANSLTPMVPLNVDVEFAAFDFIGIGGYFGFATQKYEKGYSYTLGSSPFNFQTVSGTYDVRYTYTSVGIKGVFHVIPFLNKTFDLDHGMDGSKYDLYISHYFGARVSNYSVAQDIPNEVEEEEQNELDDPNIGVSIFNTTVGGRYMFTDMFGAYAEIGYGHWGANDLKIGLTLRF